MSSRSGRGRGQKKRRGDGNGFEEWGGYMQAKIQKLQEQYQKEESVEGKAKGTTDIFNGISIHVNGYTNPTSDGLKKLMKQHGGIYHHYYSRATVTHIIASNLPNSKIAQLTDKKVVKPEWITDSVKAGTLLPYEDYLLVTGRSKVQPGLFSKGKGSFKETSAQRKTDNTRSQSAASAILEESYIEQPIVQESGPTECEDVTTNDPDLMSVEDEEEEPMSPVLPYVGDSMEEEEAPISPVLAYVGNDSEQESFDAPQIESDTRPAMDDQRGPNPPKTSPVKPHAAVSSAACSMDSLRAPAISKSGDPNFVAEFYNKSRLHYLSTWGAEFRAYVNKLQSSDTITFPGRETLRKIAIEKSLSNPSSVSSNKGKPRRVIMHIDMDCFFVSVGLLKRPDLLGKPVAVTHSRGKGITKDRPGTDLEYEKTHWRKKGRDKILPKGKDTPLTAEELERNPDLARMRATHEPASTKGTKNVAHNSSESFHSMAEIASCSYEARKLGVKNGMFMGTVKALCPDIVTIPYDFEGYRSVSQILYDTVASYTHDIEAVSCDEMLVDCTDLLSDTGASPLDFTSLLRDEIKKKTDCNSSCGLGENILLAKLATRKAKPNGQFHLESADVLHHLSEKSVSDLPGVGWSISKKLDLMGAKNCGQLFKISLGALQKEFGPKTGQSLFNYARGIDNREIKVEKERKSVSAEINYGIRFTTDADVEKFINELADEVHSRMDKINVKGKTITLKLKVRRENAPKETAKFLGHGICDNVSKSATLPLATDNPRVIAKECMGILRPLKIPADDFRGVGIQLSRLETPVGSNDKRGMQSILNFTTKSVNKDKSPASPKPEVAVRSAPVPAKVPDTPTTGDISSPSTISTNKDAEASEKVAGEKESFPMSKRTLAPLPSLPDITSPNMSFRVGQFPMSSLLPVEPSPPEINQSPSQSGLNTSTSEIYVPSPSQVDPEVLQQLPSDIRAQIEKAMAKKDRQRDGNVEEAQSSDAPIVSSSGSSDDAHPGCSHWGGRQIEDASDSISALPNISQLDPSCLDALPDDLKNELMNAYKSSGNTEKQTSKKDVHPLMLPQYRTSPTKSPSKAPGRGISKSPRKSPRKSPKHKSPIFKVPVGRAPQPKAQSSAKQLQFGDKTSASSEEDGVFPLQDETTDVNSATSRESVKKATPNLCGAETIVEVRQLIREWVSSSEEPTPEDSDQFVTYIGELVQEKELEIIYLALKSFKRMTDRKNTHKWTGAFKHLLDESQVIIQSVYGMTMKFP